MRASEPATFRTESPPVEEPPKSIIRPQPTGERVPIAHVLSVSQEKGKRVMTGYGASRKDFAW